MNLNRRTMIAGAASLPLTTGTSPADRQPERLAFFYGEEASVADILAVATEMRFDARAVSMHGGRLAAMDFVSRHRDRFSLIGMQMPAGTLPNDKRPFFSFTSGSSHSMTENLPLPLTLRAVFESVVRLTSWELLPYYPKR